MPGVVCDCCGANVVIEMEDISADCPRCANICYLEIPEDGFSLNEDDVDFLMGLQ